MNPRTAPVDASTAVRMAQALGLYIFPVAVTKAPAIRGGNGLHDALSGEDEEGVKGLWVRGGDRAFVGVNCEMSNLTVADVDTPAEISPAMNLAILNNPTLSFPSLFRGTPHHHYRGVTRTRPIAGGDIKSQGGYVILSAEHPIHNAEIALWTPELEAAAVPVAKKTDGGLRLVGGGGWTPQDTKYGIEQLQTIAYSVSRAGEGTRNNELHHAGVASGHLFSESSLTMDSIIEVLMSAAESIGLSETEARRTLYNGLRGPITAHRDGMDAALERIENDR